MNSLFYFSALLIASLIVFVRGQREENVDVDFSVDNSNYVDPFDMLNYDRRALDQQQEVMGEESSQAKEEIQEEVSERPEESVKVKLLQQKSPPDKVEACPLKPSVAQEKPFLGRFVRILSTTLDLENRKIEEEEILHIPLIARVSKQAKFIIEEALKDGEEIKLKRLADLDAVLSNLLAPDDERPRAMAPLSLFEIFNFQNFFIKDYLPTIFILCICTVLWWIYCGYSIPFIVSRSILVFFLLSWFWHYVYMSQRSVAKRQSDIMKHADMPASCKPSDVTWSSYFQSLIMNVPDPCEEYHRTFLTDPTHEVNPFTALVDMLAVAVFQPLGFIGESVGTFFNNILTSANFINKLPVLFATLFIIILILIMCFRYEIALPLIRIGPTPVVNQHVLQSSENITQTRPSILSDGAGSHVQSIESSGTERDADHAEEDPNYNARAVLELGPIRNTAGETVKEIEEPAPSHNSQERELVEADTQTLEGGFRREPLEAGTQTTEDDCQIEPHEEFLIV